MTAAAGDGSLDDEAVGFRVSVTCSSAGPGPDRDQASSTGQ